jgi:signal transduction histidine kinase
MQNRQVTFTNLSPGKYTLRVKNASDASGEDRLLIEVLPPLYRTIYALAVYIIVLAAAIYFILRSYKGKIKLQESLKYERQRIRDVENQNQSKLRFFTNISHEFRTPLTLIIGQMEILLQEKTFLSTVYKRLLNVYKNSIQLKELITELLDFRKQEQGEMKICVSEHNVVDFLHENYLLFSEYAAVKKIRFTFRKSAEEIKLWYDVRQMQKVINNLLSNAFKNTGEQGEIALSIRQTDAGVVIEIADTGVGIAPGHIDKVFDRFYQAGEADSLTGSGIGLALTKGIIDLHGGEIKVSSRQGKGATFTICLQTGNRHFAPEQSEQPVCCRKRHTTSGIVQ